MRVNRQVISGYTCPRCATDRVRRVHRQGILERIISLFNFYPYYCLDCPSKIRFYRFRKR